MRKVIANYINVKQAKEKEIEKVAKAIQNGELVVFPTETVYGIGANALDETAVNKIFEAKKRVSDNPLIVHICDDTMLKEIVKEIGEIEKRLMKTFWPGPLTIILKKNYNIPDNVSAGLDTVGVRMPSNEIANKLIQYAGVPIAAPSANVSGRPSGTTIKDIKKELEDKVSYILDDGTSTIGLESTVVQVVDGIIYVLRPGKITPEQMREIAPVEIDKHILSSCEEGEVVLSPGMKYCHYAPKTKCVLVYSSEETKLIKKINELIDENHKVLVLGRNHHLKNYDTDNKLDMGNTLEEVAHNIFGLLRKVDNYHVDLVIIEGVKKEGLGLAIMNRLLRACGHQYIEI